MSEVVNGFRLFRNIKPGEFFVVFGDTSQGGIDSNFVQFGSKTSRDIPLILQMQGVASEMTPFLRDGLNWIYKKTGVKPVVALERNNGGSSEMHNLIKYNDGSYRIYYMRDELGKPDGDKPGWDTTGGQFGTGTRPKMLGDWLKAFESQAITIYDEETIAQHNTFIVSKNGKPEAAPNTHDDAVMSAAGMWQLFQTENPITKKHRRPDKNKRLKMHI
jgi:hypothetical protein